MKTFMIPAEDERLDELNDLIEETLEPYDCPMKVLLQLQLVVEEIFVNIAHYAYAPNHGEAEITIGVCGENPVFTMVFSDSGSPFDPLAQKEADVTLSLEERAIGGLGIFLVKKYVDSASYAYENGRNVLTITRKLS